MPEIYKVAAARFIRGFVAGAVSTMVTVAAIDVNNLATLQDWFAGLFFAGVVGGITGGLLAADKVVRFEE